jgi:long-chain acyl-CoA synthetase
LPSSSKIAYCIAQPYILKKVMAALNPDRLPLQRVYHWEKARANYIFLTQPLERGQARHWTWAQALDETRRIAAYLKALGYEPGARIAIMSKNTAWWLMSDIAIWMAGYVSVPIYPNLIAESVRQILIHSETKLCIVGKLDSWQAMQPGIPEGMPCISTPLCEAIGFTKWDDIVKNTSPMQASPSFPPDSLATIIYTSGTTGMPKGVMHSFSAFTHTADALDDNIKVTTADRMLSYLPLAHVAERALVEAPAFKHGLRVYFTESLDTFMADLQRAQPTIFFSVPRLWVKFQQGILAKMPSEKLNRLMSIPLIGILVKKKMLKQLGLASVRIAGTGTAPMSRELLSWYRKLGLELLEGYGLTEQFGLATSNQPGNTSVGYVGSAVSCCDIKLSDTGEVLTRGSAHMLGYFKEPEKTQDTMTADGWFRTGDLGELDEQQRLRIVGRVKEQFKTSKGKYVSPAPIETKLGAFNQVEAFMVCGLGFAQPFALAMLPNGRWNTLKEPDQRQVVTNALAKHLDEVNSELDPHERLSFIAVVSEQWTVESGFVTPTLKMKRAALEAYYARHFDAWLRVGDKVVWQVPQVV